jgi:hypothetical protein
MLMLRTAFAVGATATLVGGAALAAAPAGATTASSVSAPSAVATAKPPPLKNYGTFTSDPVASGSQTQRRGTAHCAIGTVPLGGGVTVLSSDPLVSVNSSFPVAGGWDADVSNASASDTTFTVSVICAAKPAHYKVVQHQPVSNPAATHTTVAATCPAGSRPLGGGAASNSGGLFVTLSSTAPTGTQAWRISENNATGEDALVTVLAVCGSVQGYTVVHGPQVSVKGQSVTAIGASCPRGHGPTGGGAVIQSSSIGAFLNSTNVGDAHDWSSFATNTSAVPFKASTTLVCAGGAIFQ